MLVSAVIPSYNYGRFITTAVDSVLAQTHRELEVIVVDDGSTDDTKERIAKYGDRIRYIYQTNKGLCASRNTGIQAARGAMVALLDSDDIWLPDKLAKQIELLRQHPDAGIVATNSFYLTATGERVDPVEPPPVPEFLEYRLADFLEFTGATVSSVLVRREVFEKVGLFDETLSGSGDLDFWLRAVPHFRILELREKLTGYRTHPGSMSTKIDLMHNDHCRVLAKAFGSLPELRQSDRLRRIAWARLYRDTSWNRYSAGQRVGAIRELLRSIAFWPCALRSVSHTPQRWWRAKLLFRYALR